MSGGKYKTYVGNILIQFKHYSKIKWTRISTCVLIMLIFTDATQAIGNGR
jgi:hypothetical protein